MESPVEPKYPEVGAAFRAARKAAGMIQDDVLFASRLTLPASMWLTKATFSRIENGLSLPEPHLAQWLCHLYKCDLRNVAPELAAAIDTYEKSLTLDIRDDVLSAYGCMLTAGREHYDQLSLLAQDTTNRYILDVTPEHARIVERPTAVPAWAA